MSGKLWEPIKIKSMELKNRLGFAPFLNMPAGEDGHINDLTVRWFEQRAAGGTGLVMSGAVMAAEPDKERMGLLGQTWIGLYDDKYIEGIKKIADAVHKHGACFGMQIAPGAGVMSGRPPSPPPYPDEEDATFDFFKGLMGFDMPMQPWTIEEIEKLPPLVADAARRAKEAGVDIFELHCAHGGATMNNSFISPYYNKRTDKYGGSWENRLRLPIDTIKAMRETVGEDYPLMVRLSSDQMVGDKGVRLKDTCETIVPALEAAGVDIFDITQGDMIRTPEGILIPLYYPYGCYMDMTAEVKKATSKPVIGVGRIIDLEMANQYIEEGKADIIYMGRQLTADPDTPKKFLAGKTDEIRNCIACSGACGPCDINYDIHRDAIPLRKADSAKKVLVIGGGVGGMEAAVVARKRGHEVILMEKESELGGMVNALSKNPLKTDFHNIIDYHEREMKRLGVTVQMNKECTLADVDELKPDAVLLAAGSVIMSPEETQGQPGVMDHITALNNFDQLGQKVVVWGLAAADYAMFLAQKGKDVVLFGRGGMETLAKDYPLPRRFYVFRQLTDLPFPRAEYKPETQRVSNPEVLYNITVEEVANNEIHTVNKDGEKRSIPYDSFVVSRERIKQDTLLDELKAKVPEVHMIGDCADAQEIKEAILTANEICRKL
jgi:2,4-dienoyl-CoA reductase-like NADH-dependent reductase (Old Yellow Enzyme family)/thioredoxin reductase